MALDDSQPAFDVLPGHTLQSESQGPELRYPIQVPSVWLSSRVPMCNQERGRRVLL